MTSARTRPVGVRPAIAQGPPGCAAVAGGSQDTVLAAVAVLRAGGNAVDAAIGGLLAACVSEIVLTSLGGGGFLLVRRPDGSHGLLDFFVNTPGLGTPHSRVAPDFTPVTVRYPGTDQVFHVGPGSVAVPGVLAGILTASRRYGRLPMAEVVSPAIRLAREGSRLEALHATVLDLVREIMMLTEECARLISTPDGHVDVGERLRNPDYARFLQDLGEGRVADMTSPLFADSLLALMTHTSGHVTRADLEHYQVVDREPIHLERLGAHVDVNAPPAFGGAIVADALRRLEPIDDTPQSWLAVVRALNDATEANRVADMAAGIPHVSDGTTHISVVDAEGMLASMTTSNGSGSGVVQPGTGIHLNNMLGEEDLNPGGFHSLPPGIRMGSMMAPIILTGADGSITGMGTGGSERIRSALLLALLRMIDLGADTASAVGGPRLHPDDNGIQLEPGWDDRVVAALGRAAPVNVWPEPNLFFGGVHAVTRRADGSVTAVGDPRRGGATAVVPL